MEEITKAEAEKMIFMFLGREVRIKEKEESRISYPARYMRKSELLKMQNPLLGGNSARTRREIRTGGGCEENQPDEEKQPACVRHSGAGEMEGEALKKKIVAAEVILWVTALVAISNINWGGFFWCFSLMILGYLAFLAVDAEEKRKKTEAEKAEKKKDRVFQMWLRM